MGRTSHRSGAGRACRGLAVAISLAVGQAASAQYLSQTGNALSGGLSRSNPYASSGRDFAAEAKYRNSIVFSQAPGGFSFRGRLGYSDPSEFVGRLGSSTLNSFRRNSELSTIAAQGIQRSQAIDAQNALSTGGVSRTYQPGRGGVNFSSFYTPRTGYAKPTATQGVGAALPSLSNSAAARSFQNNAIQRDERLDRSYNVVNRLSAPVNSLSRADSSVPRLSSLGSSAAYTDPTRSADITDRLGLSGPSSRISGMDFGRTDFAAKLDGERTLANSATARGQAERAAFESQRSRTRVDSPRPTLPGSGRIDTSARSGVLPDARLTEAAAPVTAYDELRKKLDDLGIVGNEPVPPGTTDAPGRGTDAPEGVSRDWRDRLDDLRSQLLRPDGAYPDRISLLDRSKRPARPGDRFSTPAAPTEKPEADAEPGTKDDDNLRSRIDPETLKMIRDVSGRVDTFISSNAGKRDFYAEHMQNGQRLLSERMYFDAEERFSRALSNKPGDVSARTGQIHAQIGAGLWMSAGQHLRRLIAEHPETSGQRYAAELLPDPDRTRRALDQLRANVAGTGKLRRESALLIAYLGFQTSELATAREGLEAMSRISRQDPAAGSDERLVDLLRGVWLDARLYEGGAPPAGGGPGNAPK